ncbi:MAG TPA: DUF4937 domain-containing protein [Phycisphaerales bacterium]|nr:DUF4937 domain-containing protein [Phycisphaerales bacterium]
MLVKLFRCTVDHREAFARGQAAWRGLVGLTGFIAQCGGWARPGPDRAVIVGFWNDRASYDHFMAIDHDRIYADAAQSGTYHDPTAVLAGVVHPMPGSAEKFTDAVGRARLLRVADCRVRPGREAHFRDVQRGVWLPGMREVHGMLGGVFARVLDDPLRYLVLTLWASEADHDAYTRDRLGPLRERARPEADVDALDGAGVRLEPAWCVVDM